MANVLFRNLARTLNIMRHLTLSLTLLCLIAATADLRAETHRVVPKVFYNTFSGANPPALRIKSGDRVSTITLDDVGIGAEGKTLAKGPNPLTGPFYIEGADPGDLIVVTIEKLEPNRTTAQSLTVIAPDSVEPGGLTQNKGDARVPWTIDKAKGVVRLDLNTVFPGVKWETRFRSPTFDLPLRPMLGSVGVAPASKEASNPAIPGSFGGNLNYSGLVAGTRIMLPVYQRGALLYLGHGQARHGDGAIGGTGIETSMDVDFSVELVKKREWPHSSDVRASTIAGEFEIKWPRIETNEYVMAVGSGPLLQALQHATNELHHWIDDDFGLSERSLTTLLGQAIEYEIASVGYAGPSAPAAADPTFTVVAKLRKSNMPQPVPTN